MLENLNKAIRFRRHGASHHACVLLTIKSRGIKGWLVCQHLPLFELLSQSQSRSGGGKLVINLELNSHFSFFSIGVQASSRSRFDPVEYALVGNPYVERIPLLSVRELLAVGIDFVVEYFVVVVIRDFIGR